MLGAAFILNALLLTYVVFDQRIDLQIFSSSIITLRVSSVLWSISIKIPHDNKEKHTRSIKNKVKRFRLLTQFFGFILPRSAVSLATNNSYLKDTSVLTYILRSIINSRLIANYLSDKAIDVERTIANGTDSPIATLSCSLNTLFISSFKVVYYNTKVVLRRANAR